MIKNVHITNYTNEKIDKKVIHSVIKELQRILNFSISNIEINFVTSSTIHQINIQYLNHDYSTDIITFNYDNDTIKLNGEIFISVDDAKKNANEYECTLNLELLRLIIHGFLHLVGYDDMNDKDYKIMKAKEDELVELFEEQAKGIIK